jgi:hypothetical protein
MTGWTDPPPIEREPAPIEREPAPENKPPWLWRLSPLLWRLFGRRKAGDGAVRFTLRNCTVRVTIETTLQSSADAVILGRAIEKALADGVRFHVDRSQQPGISIYLPYPD